jgi:hypothetical protein
MLIPGIDQAKLADLIGRLENQRGPYMGDGINPGFKTTEVLEFLRLLQDNSLTGFGDCCYSNDIATRNK